MNKDQDNFMVGVQHALGLPLRAKCAELTVLLDRGSLAELHAIFPILVDNIFGPQGTLSWGLRTITENNCEDFRQLHHFLSPMGPMFKLIYTLMKDPNIKFDYPLAFLPSKVRQYLEDAHHHRFYADLLHINPQTKQIISLALNPFEYYVFHFAYHLINPWHQRAGSAVMSWNTVYYMLCCDYVLHFLPTNPAIPILPEVNYYLRIKNVQIMGSVNHSHIISDKSPDDSVFTKNLDRHPYHEIWRSETILTVFIDMWLHNDQLTHKPEINNALSNSQNPFQRMIQYNELPTGEYMRIIRVLIKQIHSFSDSAKADDTHLAELKKIAIPMIQGKFYIFLRNLIHRWPLDGSFRLVLELWLTYIQPWRYTATNLIKQTNRTDINPDIDDVALSATTSVDKEYLPFIADNLLAYVVIFQQLLPRFTRVDLVSPKMALMLYRITKVFDQPNLPAFIREIEQCVENNHSPSHKYNSMHWSWNLPPLAASTNWSVTLSAQDSSKIVSSSGAYSPSNDSSYLNSSINNQHHHHQMLEKKWSALVRQRIFELEGPNFRFKPLFCQPPPSEVYELIIQIKKSIIFAQELIEKKKKEEAEIYASFTNMIRNFFSTPIPNDEFSLSDRIKVPAYLEVALQNLMDMFQVTNIYDTHVEEPNLSSNTLNMSNDLKFLTPEKVKQRVKRIKYEGDPDLHPIRSNENKFLVRLLYQLSMKINQQFEHTFCRLYHEQSFAGCLSREFLSPPMTVFRFDKTQPGSPRVGTYLKPRISLRFLANYSFLSMLFFGALAAYTILGYDLIRYLLIVFVIFVLYKCIKACLFGDWNVAPIIRHNYPTEGFGNISFNDSFQ